MKKIIRLIRVYQWIKNAFLFLPAFFAGELINSWIILELVVGFFAFSFIASSVYVINDYKDIEADRQHSEKRKRVLASGEISPQTALVVAGLSLLAGFGIGFILNIRFISVIIIYFVMNLFYSIKLKHIPILDITIIAAGFLLRVIGGGFIANIYISKWLILMTFLLALFLGLAKRRDDVIIFNQQGERMRKAIDGYNLEFINASMVLMSSVIVVAYIMYTVSEKVVERIGNDHLYLTTFFVILGLLRYLQITMVENNSGSPTKVLLQDLFIQLTVIGWIIAFYFFLYH